MGFELAVERLLGERDGRRSGGAGLAKVWRKGVPQTGCSVTERTVKDFVPGCETGASESDEIG